MLPHLAENSEKCNDIIFLIQEQHQKLKILTNILKSGHVDSSEKQKQLAHFINLLAANCCAESQTIYEVLKDIKDSEPLTFEGMEEHAVAKILIDELEELNFRSQWNAEIEAKAKILAEIVEHHMAEEESEFFSLARRLLTNAELIIIGEEFKQKLIINFKAH